MKRHKAEAIGMVDSFEASHEGIKTVDVQKRCEFSGTSDLCIYFVTWNMNGQVRSLLLVQFEIYTFLKK